MIEYVHLFQEGDETIPARLHLLLEQKEHLIEQQNKISQMLKRLEYKISRYEEAVQTGKLVWKEHLIEQQNKISQMLKRLEYKISRYEEAVQTGKLVWDEDKAEECRKRIGENI